MAENTAAPIELIIYNDDDEVIETLSRRRIPSYLLDMAIDLQSKLAADPEGKVNGDALFDFVAEFYQNKYDRDAIKKGTDLIECMAVLRSIITRATALTMEFAKANPPVPSRKTK